MMNEDTSKNHETRRLCDAIQSRLDQQVITLRGMGLDDAAVERVTNPVRCYLLGLRDEMHDQH